MISGRFDRSALDRVRHSPAPRAGLNPAGGPPFKFDDRRSVAENRCREIDENGKLGQPDTLAPWYISHHLREAKRAMRKWEVAWDDVVRYGGPGCRLPTRADAMIRGQRYRFDPVCHAIKREFDRVGCVAARYRMIESRHLREIHQIAAEARESKANAPSSARKRLRQIEADACLEALKAFRAETETLAEELADLVRGDLFDPFSGAARNPGIREFS